MNPTIQIEFPPEAADKINKFKSGAGETAWNNILREFENVLGVTPVKVEALGIHGSPLLLPGRVHAGT
jgi:hypothetical protein